MKNKNIPYCSAVYLLMKTSMFPNWHFSDNWIRNWIGSNIMTSHRMISSLKQIDQQDISCVNIPYFYFLFKKKAMFVLILLIKSVCGDVQNILGGETVHIDWWSSQLMLLSARSTFPASHSYFIFHRPVRFSWPNNRQVLEGLTMFDVKNCRLELWASP